MGSYVLKGKVIEGPVAEIIVVDADDPRFLASDFTGAGAHVWAVFEPGQGIGREPLGRFVADAEGAFSVPIDATGVGLLMYEIELLVRLDGHQATVGTFAVPGSGKRILITLPRGADTLRRPGSVLDETMRDARPYLDGER